MEITSTTVTITDAKIVSYYNKNQHIDMINMTHVFIDILQKLSSNLSETMNETINSRILSAVSSIEQNISMMKLDFAETKREYIEDVKTVLTNNSLTNNEKINAIIEKNADSILTKTALLVNDIIPKGNDKVYSQIENCIKSGLTAIENDTKKILETKGKEDEQSKEIVTNIENHFTTMVGNVQQSIFGFIQSSEERTTLGIHQLKEKAYLQQHSQEKLISELTDFLNKYKHNSNIKGNVSETELYHMILHIMPSDEIIKVSSETASCDFRVNRKDTNKPSILFENKDYTRSVTTDEVKKFERDIQNQKTHGIFISQKTPITFKDNFQVDIIKGLIHVYIPNANYNTDKLKTAIEIIDQLSNKLEFIQKQNLIPEQSQISIDIDDLAELAEEYRNFGLQKTEINEFVKNTSKQLIEKMEAFQFPKIKKILVKLGSLENDTDFRCVYCNSCTWKNKASLSAHVRNCKLNPKCKEEETPSISLIEIETPITESKKSKSKK